MDKKAARRKFHVEYRVVVHKASRVMALSAEDAENQARESATAELEKLGYSDVDFETASVDAE